MNRFFTSPHALKDGIARVRMAISFARVVRLGLLAVFCAALGALVLDAFIFYRYSYRVVNFNPESVVSGQAIDRAGLSEALSILDSRAEQFEETIGGGATTTR